MAKKYHIVPVENILPEGVFVYNEDTGKAIFSNLQSPIIEVQDSINLNDITKEYLDAKFSSLPYNATIIFTKITDTPWQVPIIHKVDTGYIRADPGMPIT